MTNLFVKRVSVTPETLISQVGNEIVFLNLENENYYGLDQTGSRMWEALTKADNVQEAYDQLLKEYDVDAELLHKDLTGLIEKLAHIGLIDIKDS